MEVARVSSLVGPSDRKRSGRSDRHGGAGRSSRNEEADPPSHHLPPLLDFACKPGGVTPRLACTRIANIPTSGRKPRFRLCTEGHAAVRPPGAFCPRGAPRLAEGRLGPTSDRAGEPASFAR